jgi:cytidine deaminase
LRASDGRIFSAVHLEATIGRVAVCAEAIALGMAVADGATLIDTIVAVD